MNCGSSPTRQQGQALIEFIVVVPALIFLMAASWTLLAYQAFPVWMDEFLTLGLSIPDGARVHGDLAETHKNSAIPPYPAEDKFHWSTAAGEPIKFPPPLSTVFPGKFFSSRTVLDPAPLLKKNAPFSDLLPFDPAQLDRGLAFLPSPKYGNGEVRGVLERIVSGGVGHGTLFRRFHRIGLDPVHLNLDALPPAPEPSGGRHGH